jgi:hypothetical protein
MASRSPAARSAGQRGKLASPNRDRRAGLLALAGELRPELHRYCARLMGSVIDGEDVLEDTLVRAFVALQDLEETPPLRSWLLLFRIAHNRALEFDTECLDLVYMLRSGEPAVGGANMTLRGARAHLGGEQRPHCRAGWRLRG